MPKYNPLLKHEIQNYKKTIYKKNLEVEKIIKYREKNGSKEVLVKWVGYKVATYEPVEAVKHLKLWKTFKKKNDIKWLFH